MGTSVSINTLLAKLGLATGLPFPGEPGGVDYPKIAPIGDGSVSVVPFEQTYGSIRNIPIKQIEDELLGTYIFMPVRINKYSLPNPIIMFSGEKLVVETDVTGVIDSRGVVTGGTVFETVMQRPYDISIITKFQGQNGQWPKEHYSTIINTWKQNELVTLECALTDYVLQAENNFLITKITLLDNEGAEDFEGFQIDGKSNIDFVLELL